MKNTVRAIPEGYHSITPYLIVNNAAKAIEFYKQAFGAIELMRMGKPGEKIGHAELQIGDSKFMLADEFPEMDARSPEAFGGSPIGMHLYVKDVDTVSKKAIDAGATLIRPLENMFYGDRSCTLKDPYGHQWHVSTHIEDVSEDEIRRRAVALYNNA